MIQGAIFDLDGTLLDSTHVWDTLASDYLRSLGISPQAGLDAAVATLSLEQAAEHLRQAYTLPLSQAEILQGVRARLRRCYEEELQPKPGVAAFLSELSGRGVRMCVATASDPVLARAALDRCGLTAFFTGVMACGAEGKSSPEIYLRALKHLGTPKGCTPVFEDALYALQTAKAAGFPTVAVSDPHGDARAARAIADHYITDYASSGAFLAWAGAIGREEGS